MPIEHQTLREIVVDADVQEDLTAWSARIDRFREAWLALEWRLARNADIGWRHEHAGLDVRLWKQGGIERFGSPDITVLYILTDAQVQIKSVKVMIGGKAIESKRSAPH